MSVTVAIRKSSHCQAKSSNVPAEKHRRWIAARSQVSGRSEQCSGDGGSAARQGSERTERLQSESRKARLRCR